MRTSLATPPQFVEGYCPYFAAMQMAERPDPCEPYALSPLPALECLKSLDDLDEESDQDDEDEDLDDEDDDLDDDEDEDLDDEDEDFDEEEDDEDEDEEEEDEDGGVKPLKM